MYTIYYVEERIILELADRFCHKNAIDKEMRM